MLHENQGDTALPIKQTRWSRKVTVSVSQLRGQSSCSLRSVTCTGPVVSQTYYKAHLCQTQRQMSRCKQSRWTTAAKHSLHAAQVSQCDAGQAWPVRGPREGGERWEEGRLEWREDGEKMGPWAGRLRERG